MLEEKIITVRQENIISDQNVTTRHRIHYLCELRNAERSERRRIKSQPERPRGRSTSRRQKQKTDEHTRNAALNKTNCRLQKKEARPGSECQEEARDVFGQAGTNFSIKGKLMCL